MGTGIHRLTRLPTTSHGLLPRRFYAWKTNPAFEAEAQPTVISEDGSKTLRTRKHGNKSLPLPPIMDPIARASKQRHKQMKDRGIQNDELSDFQQKLRLNPYGTNTHNSLDQPYTLTLRSQRMPLRPRSDSAELTKPPCPPTFSFPLLPTCLHPKKEMKRSESQHLRRRCATRCKVKRTSRALAKRCTVSVERRAGGRRC